MADIEINQDLPANGMFNMIGYSWGAIIVARSALYHANMGVTVDNLVLIGAPVNQSLLQAVQSHPLIKKTWIINLTIYGDPIYAGIRDKEIIDSSILLGQQMLEGSGHFYYSGSDDEGMQRRRQLARTLHGYGLR